MLDFEKATKLLPYEFTKDNNIIAFQDDDLIEVLHCEEINIQLYTEIRRYIGTSFKLTKLSQIEFNDILTSNFAADEEQNNDIAEELDDEFNLCLLYTSPSPRDGLLSRMPSSA